MLYKLYRIIFYFRQMQNRSSCSKRRGNSPLEGEDNSDNDMASIATHRMYPKVRKYSTEKDLSIGLDGPIPESKFCTLCCTFSVFFYFCFHFFIIIFITFFFIFTYILFLMFFIGNSV